MANISEAYESSFVDKPRGHFGWLIVFALVIVIVLLGVMFRTGQQSGQYQRMSEALNNYDQR